MKAAQFRMCFVVGVALVVSPAGPSLVAASFFFNPTPIILASNQANAAPYPSSITVSGLTGLVSNVSVALSNLNHTRPDDLDILLVAPSGTRTLLMSDAGGGVDVSGVTLVFRNTATNSVPNESQLFSGTYAPANHTGAPDTFPLPAPAGPYSTNLVNFNGSGPNGAWQLYVIDNFPSSDFGSISGGWRLEVSVVSPPSILQPPQSRTAIVGDTVVFSVAATGTAPLMYQWRKFGLDIPGANSSSLVLSGVGLIDAGSYDVRVSNASGTVTSSEAVLTVLSSTIRINEWMADNQGTLQDEDGDFGDWIELYNPNPSPVNLSGWFLTDNLANAPNWMVPSNVVIAAGGFLLFWADSKDRVNHTDFRLNNTGESVGLATPDGVLRDGVSFGQATANVSEGRFPDGNGPVYAMTMPTPNAPNQLGPIAARVEIPLSPAGASWKYRTGTDLGSAWRSLGFNDGNWPTGPAQLGFGDGDESTVIDGGPSTNRHVTAYFRRFFNVTNSFQYSNLTLRLLRDDGAVVYVNGMEIRRDNLPTTNVTYSTFATNALSGADETNFFTTSVSPNVLSNGLNLLAVEVHQATSFSSDLSFDLALLAGGPDLLPGVSSSPSLITVPPGSGVTLRPSTPAGAVAFQWLRNGYLINGATGATLWLPDVRAGDGGSYSVLVKDALGRNSLLGPFNVNTVSTPVPASADSFFARMNLTGTNGTVQGVNTNATREFGEPFHHGTSGNRSVWFTWRSPFSGVATFDTQGSGFDTLLASYTGFALSNLVAVASDDDTIGFGASQIRFNVRTNVDYQIAVDGADFASGPFALNWSLEVTPQLIPTVRTPPGSRTVRAGGDLLLSVDTPDSDVSYQWFFNGLLIPGAVSSSLYLANVQPVHLGDYTVRLRNSWGRLVWTSPARVMLGDCAQFYDKPSAFLLSCDSGPFVSAANRFSLATAAQFGIDTIGSTNPPSGAVPGSIPVGAAQGGQTRYEGTTGMNFYDTKPLVGPQYLYLTVLDNGLLELNTCGSDFPLLLALYKYSASPALLDSPTYRVASDLTNGPIGLPALVRAEVAAGNYTVIVSGYSGATGTLQLNQRLSPICHLVSSGMIVTINASTSYWAGPGPLPTNFVWMNNGVFYRSTLAPSLPLGLVQPAHVGTYSLAMSNILVKTTNIVADVILTNEGSPPFYRDFYGLQRDGYRQFYLEARSNRRVILESTPGFPANEAPTWTRITTNFFINFLDCGVLDGTQRHFRVLRPLP